VEIAARQCGREAADVLAAPFVLADPVELARLVADGGIWGANVTLHEGSIRFPSVKEFIRVMQSLAEESETALVEFVVASGEIVMPMDAHIVTAGEGEAA
jgi:hypothetical protein